MSKILFVEDDFGIAEALSFALREEGYQVTHVASCGEARPALDEAFDLAILDISLPDGSGYDLCRSLRQKNDTPVLFLTALDEEVNVVMGLDMGAVDYVTKPFRLRELLSRVRGILRRTAGQKKPGVTYCLQDISLDSLTMQVKKGEEEIFLSAQEYRLLLFLMRHPNQVLTREQIVRAIWDEGGDYVNDNTLTVTIRRLREKIGDDKAAPERIVTVRGFGYKAVP